MGFEDLGINDLSENTKNERMGRGVKFERIRRITGKPTK